MAFIAGLLVGIAVGVAVTIAGFLIYAASVSRNRW